MTLQVKVKAALLWFLGTRRSLFQPDQPIINERFKVDANGNATDGTEDKVQQQDYSSTPEFQPENLY